MAQESITSFSTSLSSKKSTENSNNENGVKKTEENVSKKRKEKSESDEDNSNKNVKPSKKQQRLSEDNKKSPPKQQKLFEDNKKSPEKQQKISEDSKKSPEKRTKNEDVTEDIKPTKIKRRNRLISSSSESENDVQNNSKENANVSDNEIDERLPKTPEKKTNGTIKIEENDSSKQEKKANDSPKKTPEIKITSFFAPKKSKSPKVEANKSDDTKPTDNSKTGVKSLSLNPVSKNEIEYNPTLVKYHPIESAIWKRGERVPYIALARTWEEIENISARLKIQYLSNYFRSVLVLTPDDLLPSVYLCLNKLAPAYEGLKLGIAETTLMKAIGQATGRTVAQIKSDAQSTGDLGIVAEQSRSNQRIMFQPAKLTVKVVLDKLKDIAQMTGHASMGKKVDKIKSMFVACRHSESRFLIRLLGGKLRIGLAEQSLLQALALAFATTPPCQDYPPEEINIAKKMSEDAFKQHYDKIASNLKTIYCERRNYDMIIPTVLKHGVLDSPNYIGKLTLGVPHYNSGLSFYPMKGLHEVLTRCFNVKFKREWIYYGERLQIHISEDGKVSIFNRNQENNTTKYQDIISRIPLCKKDSVKSCILDSEAVAWDDEKKEILPFQVLSTRKRKDANEADIKVKVCVFMFDLLYLNGAPLVHEPFSESRTLLRKHFIPMGKEGDWIRIMIG